jgi:RNA polymerase sigma factor (sigma-70 family)
MKIAPIVKELKSNSNAQSQFDRLKWIVVNLACKFTAISSTREDLEQRGDLALMKAIGSFDPSKGKLVTYAYNGIRKEMLYCLREAPDSSRDISLQTPITSNDKTAGFCTFGGHIETLQDTLADSNPNPEEAFLLDEQNEIVNAALQRLEEQDRVLIQMYFWDGYSIRDIAKNWGESKSYIGRELQRVLSALRPHLQELAR